MAPPPTEADTRGESHDSLREIKIGDPEVHNNDQQHHHRSSQDRLNSTKVQKSVSNNTLSSRNLSLHDGVVAGESPESPLDLDQTTMIGSALDLDSLEGDRSEPQQTSQNGSQVYFHLQLDPNLNLHLLGCCRAPPSGARLENSNFIYLFCLQTQSE